MTRISLYKSLQIVIMAVFGVLLMFPFHGFFGAVGSLHVVAFLCPLWVLGIVALSGALLSSFVRTRVIGWLISFVVAGIYCTTCFLSLLFTPIPHPASIIFSVIIAATYLDSLAEAVHVKYN